MSTSPVGKSPAGLVAFGCELKKARRLATHSRSLGWRGNLLSVGYQEMAEERHQRSFERVACSRDHHRYPCAR